MRGKETENGDRERERARERESERERERERERQRQRQRQRQREREWRVRGKERWSGEWEGKRDGVENEKERERERGVDNESEREMEWRVREKEMEWRMRGKERERSGEWEGKRERGVEDEREREREEWRMRGKEMEWRQLRQQCKNSKGRIKMKTTIGMCIETNLTPRHVGKEDDNNRKPISKSQPSLLPLRQVTMYIHSETCNWQISNTSGLCRVYILDSLTVSWSIYHLVLIRKFYSVKLMASVLGN